MRWVSYSSFYNWRKRVTDLRNLLMVTSKWQSWSGSLWPPCHCFSISPPRPRPPRVEMEVEGRLLSIYAVAFFFSFFTKLHILETFWSRNIVLPKYPPFQIHIFHFACVILISFLFLFRHTCSSKYFLRSSCL